ncbi:MAG TPA: tRNA (adenosine(37)-N6)-threonylcarbamoyltransferase complex dimerization subunit type 1 TsaB [Armatimonadetes bacterium]|nr:tRNA (adenosine(37)-N6)-threonylcarbamoyltransferase complex dimerization subunit type 1 TsaB [Armatimonadota bacterium]
MTILGMETSTPLASVAVLSAQGLLGEVSFRCHQTLAQRLILCLQQLLAEIGLTVADLEGIAVSRGPGSFTSVRVGMATAKGLAQALSLPLVGVSALDALAMGLPDGEAILLCPLLKAPKRHFYTALYQREAPDAVRRVAPYALLSLEELALRLMEREQPVLVGGPLTEEERIQLQEHSGVAIHWAPTSLSLPRAALVAELGRQRLMKGERDELFRLLPLYVKPSEPEEKLGRLFTRVETGIE